MTAAPTGEKQQHQHERGSSISGREASAEGKKTSQVPDHQHHHHQREREKEGMKEGREKSMDRLQTRSSKQIEIRVAV